MKYDRVDKYIVKASLRSPMHVGSGEGNRQEILIHPSMMVPFIQGSSITGAMRDYYEQKFDDAEKVFGSSEKIQQDILIKVTDGMFSGKTQTAMEFRPRVSIDPKSGTVSSSKIKGTDIRSGHKFDMEYIGTGAVFSFSVYLYRGVSQNDDHNDRLMTVFSAIQLGDIVLGGQKSNGCGDVEISHLFHKEFDLKKESDRTAWIKESELKEADYIDLKNNLDKTERNVYQISLKAEIESGILVKGYEIEGFGEKAPDAVNIRNAEKDYIIPGSSLKGAIRSRTEYIVKKMDLDHSIIDEVFGVKSSGLEGVPGNARFYDSVIGKKEKNDRNDITTRIHIDKFTAGVINGQLFKEKTASGDITLRIDINNKYCPERAVAIIILALRDLASGLYNLGGGYHVGHGFLKVSEITVKKGKKQAVIDYRSEAVNDPEGLLQTCLSSVKKGDKA